MKVTGFSFIRNAILYDYPVIEAVQSILPLCDNFIIATGKSDDNTLELIRSIDAKKIRIIETVWDDNLREGGKTLALETKKAFSEISGDTDWAFYIQADEIAHEKYFDEIYGSMKRYLSTPRVDGLLFNYLHFYGSYDYVGSSSRWYRNEVRIIRNDKSIYSYRDAQGFRKEGNRKLCVKPIDAWIYHYGWVKEPKAMQKKQEKFHTYWHNDQWVNEKIKSAGEFDYSGIDCLLPFKGTHPDVMKKRIMEKNWKFDHDISRNRLSQKEKGKIFFMKYFGLDFNYKNYRII